MDYHPTAFGRGFNDATEGLEPQVNRENPKGDRDDYQDGYDEGLRYIKSWPEEVESQPTEPEKLSAAGSLIDKIVADTQRSREVIMDNLMRNPGFLATMGDDFVVDFGPVSTYTVDNPEINPLDAIHLRVEHTVVVRSRDFVDKQLKEQSLRQDPEGNLESV